MPKNMKIPESLEEMKKYSQIFLEELDLLKKEIKTLDNIYDEMKTAIETAKRSGRRNNRTTQSPFTFIFNMYANMNTNRTNKISIIKELAKLKKTIADLTFRDTRGDEMEEKFKALAGSLFKQIKASEDENDINEVEEEIKDLDLIAKSAYKDEIGTEYTGPEEEILYVCDEDEGRIFIVNDLDELEIIDEIEEEKIPEMFQIDWKINNTVRRCLDLSSGSNIPVIKFEESEE